MILPAAGPMPKPWPLNPVAIHRPSIADALSSTGTTSGRASILGLDSHEDAVEIRRHIGYVPGDLALYPNLTGRDTLTYFANLRGGVDWAHVDDLASRLDADLSKKVGDLSSGNRQKVGLIQAFMNRPSVLVMDEPSSGLDPLMQREFQSMVQDRRDKGFNVIQIVAGLYPDMQPFDALGDNEAGQPWEQNYVRIRPEYADR